MLEKYYDGERVNRPTTPILAARAYWTLDEEDGIRLDSVGGYHLTPTNSPESAPGQIGGAARFTDTSNQILERAAGGQIDLDGALGITLTMWIKVRAGAPTGATFFMNGIFFTSYIHLSTANSTPLTMAFGITNDVGEGSSVGSTTPAYDTWYFWAFKYDPATRKASIRRDGGAWVEGITNLDSGHPTIGAGYGAGIVHIGGENFHPFYSRSDIDEVGLWNKVLTDDEVDYLYALNRPSF